MQQVLLLNASYEPLKVISWQKAVCLYFDDKVDIVANYSEVLTSQRLAMPCPAVVRLRKYVTTSRNRVKFNRINVFARDNFQCQYCGCEPSIKELTYDHVVPKSRGGKTTWTNIVTSCYPCNSKKSDRTPDEAKMALRSKPVKPIITPYMGPRLRNTPPEEWLPYL